MSSPQFWHRRGNSSPTQAMSFAQAIRDASWERGLAFESQHSCASNCRQFSTCTADESYSINRGSVSSVGSSNSVGRVTSDYAERQESRRRLGTQLPSLIKLLEPGHDVLTRPAFGWIRFGNRPRAVSLASLRSQALWDAQRKMRDCEDQDHRHGSTADHTTDHTGSAHARRARYGIAAASRVEVFERDAGRNRVR